MKKRMIASMYHQFATSNKLMGLATELWLPITKSLTTLRE